MRRQTQRGRDGRIFLYLYKGDIVTEIVFKVTVYLLVFADLYLPLVWPIIITTNTEKK